MSEKNLMYKLEITDSKNDLVPILICILPKTYPISLKTLYNSALQQKCDYVTIKTYNLSSEDPESCFSEIKNNISDLDLIDIKN